MGGLDIGAARTALSSLSAVLGKRFTSQPVSRLRLLRSELVHRSDLALVAPLGCLDIYASQPANLPLRH
jgi:hypothetical protein